MKTIKFRVWDQQLERMFVPGDNYTEVIVLSYNRDGSLDYIKVGEQDFDWGVNGYQWDAFYKKENTLMQFTGLVDKNGKEIFEGDIIDWTNGAHRTFNSSEFVPNISQFVVNAICDVSQFRHVQKSLCVVGNIYESPELLSND